MVGGGAPGKEQREVLELVRKVVGFDTDDLRFRHDQVPSDGGTERWWWW